jgi:hypothetical protein
MIKVLDAHARIKLDSFAQSQPCERSGFVTLERRLFYYDIVAPLTRSIWLGEEIHGLA